MAQKKTSMKPFWLLLFLLLVLAAAVWQASLWSYRSELESLRQTGEERLALYTGTLNSLLSRMENLPYVLAHNDAVARLLIHQDNLEQLNRNLESLNYWAGTKALYVMDEAGDIVASSTWREPINLIGGNYSFRPYFTAAKAGQQGRLFAIGLETKQPGLFMSHSVSREGRFLGVVVVEADLDPLIEDWREGGERVLISDANDVIILSSNSDWSFKTLNPLQPDKRAELSSSMLYNDQPLDQAPFKFQKSDIEGSQFVRSDRQNYLMVSRFNPQLDWTLAYLAPLKQVKQRSQSVLLIGGILTLFFLALSMYGRERRLKKLSRKKLKEAAIIKQMNLRLQEEIEEHYRTEQALRDAQAELVQSSKLAALGQMAAGIVHELNQPISAMRTYAASGRLLLDRDQKEKAYETFSEVTRITDHMAEITAQLKIFAHKTPRENERVVLQNCLDGALSMTEPLIADADVELQKHLPNEPLAVYGGRGRVEQVLVNLIRNGVDAMEEAPRRILRVAVKPLDGVAEIAITDTGTGIDEKNLDELFNPFFTTKEVGKGLGLGLSISYRIVTDLGGTIRARNNPEGGAVFTVRLPLAEEEQTAGENV